MGSGYHFLLRSWCEIVVETDRHDLKLTKGSISIDDLIREDLLVGDILGLVVVKLLLNVFNNYFRIYCCLALRNSPVFAVCDDYTLITKFNTDM